MTIFPKRQQALIGLDIQPNCIKLIQLKSKNSQWEMALRKEAKTPSNIFANGRIKDWSALIVFLQPLIEEWGVKNAKVAVSLPVELTHIQHLPIPKGLTHLEILNAIETSGLLPISPEKLRIDYQQMDLVDPGYQQIIFVAASESYLQDYEDCIKQINLQVQYIDIDAYAILRALKAVLPLKVREKNRVGILYVQECEGCFFIFKEGLFISKHTFTFKTSEDFVNEVQVTLSDTADTSIFILGKASDLHAFLTTLQIKEVTILTPEINPHLQPQDWLGAGMAMRKVLPW